jgi:diadenosine tetraphosphate (Ap4A) HIT family hydrolase
MPHAVNDTMRTFGYPDSLVADLGGWVVLLRPRQVTLGSVVLAAADPATAFSHLPADTSAGLGAALRRTERGLKAVLQFDKLNALMLMMVDPHVHFHVIPRYAKPVTFAGVAWPDAAWPKPPVMSDALDLPDGARAALRAALSAAIKAA